MEQWYDTDFAYSFKKPNCTLEIMFWLCICYLCNVKTVWYIFRVIWHLNSNHEVIVTSRSLPKMSGLSHEIRQMELMMELFDNKPLIGNLNRRQFKKQQYPLSLWPAGQYKYIMLFNYYLLTVLGHTGSVPIGKLHVFPLLQGMAFWKGQSVILSLLQLLEPPVPTNEG